jgi:hypothetical protein
MSRRRRRLRFWTGLRRWIKVVAASRTLLAPTQGAPAC